LLNKRTAGKAIERLAKREDADVFLFNSQIQPARVDQLRRLICQRNDKRKNVILFLTTNGGDPDSAFRLAACLRRNYKKFSAYIFGYCKSAGTLTVLGADQIVMGDYGELGPLDVQLAKPDELLQASSGLDIFQAMGVLTNSAFEAFQQYLIAIIANSDGAISAKTAAEIARELAVGLFAPMTGQIEPERLGEVQRAINIANVYGDRLSPANRTNLKKGALERLVQGYPTHGFVIDIDEAKALFQHVREADATDREVARFVSLRSQSSEPIICDLVEIFGTKGTSDGTRTKPKRTRRGTAPAAASSGHSANVSQLRPDTTSDVETAQEDTDARGAAVVRKPRPRTRPIQSAGN